MTIKIMTTTRPAALPALKRVFAAWDSQKPTATAVFAAGILCWFLATGPSAIGMVQLLLDGGTTTPTIFELLFLAGGCCVAPLYLGMNLFWAVRCFQNGSWRLAIFMAVLGFISWMIAESGIF